MESPYKRVDFATVLDKDGGIKDEQREEDKKEDPVPIAEYPSVMYETHDEAYANDDVIKVYAVIELNTEDLCIELVSEKLSRIDYVRLALQDRTDPQYGKIIEDEAFLRESAEKFDRAIHDEMLVVSN